MIQRFWVHMTCLAAIVSQTTPSIDELKKTTRFLSSQTIHGSNMYSNVVRKSMFSCSLYSVPPWEEPLIKFLKNDKFLVGELTCKNQIKTMVKVCRFILSLIYFYHLCEFHIWFWVLLINWLWLSNGKLRCCKLWATKLKFS